MRNYKKSITLAIFINLCMMNISSVSAGLIYKTNGVYIYTNPDSSGLFVGTIGGTRNTSDSIQYIECFNDGAIASCSARDLKRKEVKCATDKPDLINTIRSLTNSSSLQVNFNSQGICTSIAVFVGSKYQPKR